MAPMTNKLQPSPGRPPVNGDILHPNRATLLVTHSFLDGQKTITVPSTRLGILENDPRTRRVSVEWLSGPHIVLVAVTPTSRRAMAALPVLLAHLRTLPSLTVAVPDTIRVHVPLDIPLVAPVGEPPKSPRTAPPPPPPPHSVPAFCRPGAVDSMELSPFKISSEAVTTRPITTPDNGANITEKPATTASTTTPRKWVSAGDVDLVICLGGDGLIFHVLSKLFPTAVPPVVPFNMGSMGFLTPFDFADHERSISSILTERKHVALRMRLRCVVERAPVTATKNGLEGQPTLAHAFSDNCLSERAQQPGTTTDRTLEEYHVLNDLVIDRGPAPYLSNLEVLCDDCAVTRVQADGLIVATPTGSTAYSLSSGGSMVHPSVPAILFTPICPHSLSFRPVLFPEHVTLQIKVPSDARATAWVSFDGRHRMELMKGDRVVVSLSRWWVPTFTRADTTNDWFSSVSQCLRWNERVVQGAGENDADPLS